MIQPNLLCATQDVDTTLRGLKMVRAIADTFAAKSAWLGDETLPGKDVTTDEQLIAFLKKYAVSDFHYVGSCRMGSTSDRSAVVDNQLRVHGVERLRVVDASIMPSLVSGNTNAASNMIGGHAADFVLTGRKS
jgi:choline dehydrogenase